MSVDLFGEARSMEAALSDLIETVKLPIRIADRDQLSRMIQYLQDEIALRAERQLATSGADD